MTFWAAVGNFFKDVGVRLLQAWDAAETFQKINMVLSAATLAVGVKGFLQARNMLAKGQDIMANKVAAGGKIPVVYGTRRVGAQIVYMDTAQNRSKDLFVVYALCVGEVESIIGNTIELDGNAITDKVRFRDGWYLGSDKINSGAGSLCTADQVGSGTSASTQRAGQSGTDPTKKYRAVFNLHHGAASQTADPMLRASIGSQWTTAHRLDGIAYIAASFEYDTKGMWKGVPQLTVQVKGRKVFDPRTSTTAYSDNAALCFLDFIRNNEYGKGIPDAKINMTTFSAAANLADTQLNVPYYNGNFQNVTFNGRSGDNFITITDNEDWWQNKVDQRITLKDSNGTTIIDDKSIDAVTRYKYFGETTQDSRVYFDGVVPPRDTTADGGVTLSATNGDATITVTDNSHGAAANDEVLLTGAVSLGGNITAAVINQVYTIATVINANSYTIEAEDLSGTTVLANSSDTGNGGNAVGAKYQYKNDDGTIRGRSKRFTCNGYIDTNKNVMDNAKELLANMRGIFTYFDGKYELKIEDTGSATFNITDAHIIEDNGISVDYGNKDAKANKVIVEFFNANKRYELDTATVFHNASPQYFSDDGDEILEIKAEFPYVTSPYIAYNMAKTILTRSRNQTKVSFLGTAEMYKLNIGDIVDLTYVGLGFSSKVFIVEALELQPNGLVGVSLLEYFDVYTWEVPPQEPTEPLQNTPSAYAVSPPDNVAFTDTNASPTGRPRITWDAPTDYPDYEFRVAISDSGGNALQNSLVETNFVDLNFIPVGSNYVASVTSINSTGSESNATTLTFSVANAPIKAVDIQANQIDANLINVSNLSAISADLGSITAGSINIGSGAFTVSSSGVMTATGATVSGAITASSLNVTGATVTGTLDASVITINGEPLDDAFGVTGTGSNRIMSIGFQAQNQLKITDTGLQYLALSTGGSGIGFESFLANGTDFRFFSSAAGNNQKETIVNKEGSITLSNLSSAPSGSAQTNSLYLLNGALQFNGSAVGTGTGDITAVVAGTNLNGGGTTGSVTLNLDSTITGNHTFSNNLIVGGDLTVQGTTTTIDTTNLDVKDKNITLNYSTGDSSANANGAGITIQDAVDASTDATILWDATNDEFDFSHGITLPDDKALKFGASNDLVIDHNSSNTVSRIIDNSGILNIQQSGDDGQIRFQCDDGSGGVTTYYQISGLSETNIFFKDIKLSDNLKVNLGASNDLKIYHDGNDSRIQDTGAGNLLIDGQARVNIRRTDNGNFMGSFIAGGAVELYHNAGKRLETTSTGVDVTGTLTATTLAGTLSTASQPNITSVGTLSTLTVDDITINGSTISDGGNLTFDVGGGITFDADGGQVDFKDNGTLKALIDFTGNNVEIQSRVTDGDLLFRGQDGSSFITALTLDMSEAGAASFNSTISSGAITSTGTSTFGTVTSASYKVGASTVIDNSRNLINIGTINSGLITPNIASNGTLIDLQTGSASRGKIGVVSGDLAIHSSESGHKGLRFGAGFIAPTSNSTTIEDATTDLGIDSARFRNLKLSGTISSGAITSTGQVKAQSLFIDSGGYTPQDAEGQEFKYYLVSQSTDQNFKKVADVTISTGSFKALALRVVLESQAGNFGNTVAVDKTEYVCNFYRSASTLNDVDSATISGQDPTFHNLRIVKTATGVYELQVKQNANYRDAILHIEILSTNGGSITITDGNVDGSTSGTITTPTSSETASTYSFNKVDTPFLNIQSSIKVNSTQILDSARNLSNIGTISSGAITSSGQFLLNVAGAGTTVMDVQGNYSANGDVKLAQFKRSGGAVAAAIEYNDATTDMEFGTVTSHAFSLKTADTRRLTIDTSGNATFAGTLTTASTIKVDPASGDAIVQIEGASGAQILRIDQNSIRTSTNSDLSIFTNGNTRQIFLDQSSGHVGINMGSENPNSALHISNNAAPADDLTLLTLQNGNSTGDIGTPNTFIDFQFKDSNSNVVPQARIGAHAGDGTDANTQIKEGKGYLTFHTSDTTNTSGTEAPPERLRITHDGNIGVGQTNPITNINTNTSFMPVDSSGKFLTLNGGANGSFIMLESSTTTNGDQLGGLFWTRTGGQADAHKQVAGIDANFDSTSLGGGQLRFFTKPVSSATATPRMQIDQAGNIKVGTTTIIDQSRNLTNIGTVSCGAITSSGNMLVTANSSSNHSFEVKRASDGSQALRVNATGEVVVSNNYLYATGSGVGFYVQNNARFRGNIGNDISGQPLTVADDMSVTGSFNATSAGSIPSIRGGGSYGGGIGFVDTNVSGMYTDGSGANLRLFTNQSGSDRADAKIGLSIDGSQRVGIGTTSPSASLDVNGNVRIGATGRFQTSTNVFKSMNTAEDGALIRAAVSSASNPTFSNVDDTNTGMFFAASDILGFTTGGTERLRIASDGKATFNSNITIPATVPSSKGGKALRFPVDADVSGTTELEFYTPLSSPASTLTVNNTLTAGAIDIPSNGTNDTRIEIGTSPLANHNAFIDLVGDTTYNDYGLRLIRFNGGANTNSQLVHRGTGGLFIEAQDAGSVILKTNGSDGLTIDSSQTATFSGIQKFSKSVYGDFSTENFYRIKFQDQGGITNDVGIGQFQSGALGFNVTQGQEFRFNEGTDGVVGVIGANGVDARQGGFRIGTTTVIDSSRNLTNIGTINSGIITSTGASSGRYTGLEVVNSTNAGGTETAIGLGVISASNTACDVKLVANRVGANFGSDFYIEQTDSSGSQQETFRISESGNVTFAGEIFLGNNKEINFAKADGTNDGTKIERFGGNALRFRYAGNAAIFDDLNNNGFQVRNSGDTEVFRVIPNSSVGSSTTDIVNGALRMGSTTIIDVSRNLTNIGTISSGAVTSSALTVQPAIGAGDALVTVAQTNVNAYVHAGIKINAGNTNPFYIYQSGSSNTLRFNYNSLSDAGGQMVLTDAGNLTISGDITAFSDQRLKDNIQTLDGKKALQMRGVSFTKDGKQGSGVIAQEIEKIAPELVATADDEQGTKSVAYGNLVGYLIEAIKEQQEQIEELKAKLEEVA